MKPLVTLCMLYFTTHRAQRWLAVISVILICVEVGMQPVSPLGGALGLFGGLVLVLPIVTGAPFVFRALSVPQAHRLSPYFRVRMLVALAIVLAACVLAAFVLLRTLTPIEVPQQPALVLLSCGMLLVSAFVITLFSINGSTMRLLLFAPAFYAVLSWLARDGQAYLTGHPVGTAATAATALIVLWVSFAAWYLHVGEIAPFGHFRKASIREVFRYNRLQREQGAPFLIGDESWGSAERLLMSLMTAAAGTSVLWAAQGLIGDLEQYLPLLLSGPVVVMYLTLPRTDYIAANSRSLWLRSGHSRNDIFGSCERELLRIYFWNAIFIAVLIAGVSTLVAAPNRLAMASVLVVCLSTGTFLLYLGAMHVNAFRTLDVVAAISLVASEFVALWAILVQPTELAWLGLAIGFQFIGSCACRFVAKSRWRNIDWIQLRPGHSHAALSGIG